MSAICFFFKEEHRRKGQQGRGCRIQPAIQSTSGGASGEIPPRMTPFFELARAKEKTLGENSPPCTGVTEGLAYRGGRQPCERQPSVSWMLIELNPSLLL